MLQQRKQIKREFLSEKQRVYVRARLRTQQHSLASAVLLLQPAYHITDLRMSVTREQYSAHVETFIIII